LKGTLIVLAGSGIGGLFRHWLNTLVTGLVGTAFPWGILLVNLIGCTAMGLVIGWFSLRLSAPQELRLFLTTGILGGFTTFSAFSLDTAVLCERGEPVLAAIYVVASVVLSIAGLIAAMWAVRVTLS
jgi:CrcB protein